MPNRDRHATRMSKPLNRVQLQQRLRALLLVGLLLLPAFCVFGGLALLAVGWARWLILSLWVLLGAVLGGVIARLLNTLAALNHDPRDE